MGYIGGVHLLPSTGEFTYDTIAHQGQRLGGAMLGLNTFYGQGGAYTDYSVAIDQLQAAHPECTTVSVVCAWFGNNETVDYCQIYPATTYVGGSFGQLSGGAWIADEWRVSGLTQASPGLIPIPQSGDSFIYGGTPSDQSIVRCVRDLKARGFRVVFYPFILMTAPGLPWRGRISYFSGDVSSAAIAAVDAFLGAATIADFTPDPLNLTVAYSGAPTDYTYRRMILHYAWLMTIAGGVDLFLLGSELRGLETIRGPAWTRAGATDGSGHAIWDYPFVAGLQALANDVRTIFDSQGLTRNLSTLNNLIAYSADWSDWMGFQHPGENGQWPHLDSLFADANIDLVGFDNYLPLSDWTTQGGLDVANWNAPAPGQSYCDAGLVTITARQSVDCGHTMGAVASTTDCGAAIAVAWPPAIGAASGLGLSGAPTLPSVPYLQANIEGGQYFDWFYNDSNNDGPGLDPLGSDQQVSLCEGDRLAQKRNPYYPNQQLLANKQLRWWWSNPHQAIYDNGDGSGWSPHGPQTAWIPQSKSIAFVEYGFPAVDKGTNQPNVFYNPASVESFTPFWSTWTATPGGGRLPLRDDTLALTALRAIYAYWNGGANNVSATGVALLQFAFCCVWNWDARPFPTFPLLTGEWGDAGNWAYGDWLGGRGPATPPAQSSPPPAPASYPSFPTLTTLGWSTHISPRFATDVADLVSGRSVRRSRYAAPLYDIELTYELLRSAAAYAELQEVAGFFAAMLGKATPFWVAPPGLASLAAQAIGTGDGSTSVFPLLATAGGYSAAAQGTSGVSAVYLDGAPLGASRYAISAGAAPMVTIAPPPAAGVSVTADFGLLMLCRFSDDFVDLEEFMAMLWTFKTVKLQTVRF
jgi:uncharacterized protein (TIGR02217 family)